jgi:FkbM family methyltransferase
LSFGALKFFLPDHPVLSRVWFGPFRGARIITNPRNSLRKILGLYEHELNDWLEQALYRVTRVLDVGANDGYFTFGCAAAFRRLGRAGQIIAFEPDVRCAALLEESLAAEARAAIADARGAACIKIIQTLVGRELKPGTVTLDSLVTQRDKKSTLIKIDVDGTEVDVIEGSRSWLDSSNLFVIEVHEQQVVAQLRSLFAERSLQMLLLKQRPLPVLGRETRPENNCWLVSDLGTVA